MSLWSSVRHCDFSPLCAFLHCEFLVKIWGVLEFLLQVAYYHVTFEAVWHIVTHGGVGACDILRCATQCTIHFALYTVWYPSAPRTELDPNLTCTMHYGATQCTMHFALYTMWYPSTTRTALNTLNWIRWTRSFKLLVIMDALHYPLQSWPALCTMALHWKSLH